jgi:hypothetical protein
LGESYAHFQSAQATHKYLKKAKKALEGLSWLTQASDGGGYW